MPRDDTTSPSHGSEARTLGFQPATPAQDLLPDPVRRMLDEVTHTPLPLVAVQGAAQEIGPLLGFLVRLVGARRIVAAGTGTEAAILPMAEALPPDGTLLICDASQERAERARGAGLQAGMADRIERRTGPVAATLRDLSDAPLYDLAYIAADRAGTAACWEALVPRTRQGGLLVVQHAFRHGDATEGVGEGATEGASEGATEGAAGPQATELVATSEGPEGPEEPGVPVGPEGPDEPDGPGDGPVAGDERVDAVVLGLAGGLTLARKK